MTVIVYSRLFEQELTSLNKNHIPLNELKSVSKQQESPKGDF